MNDYPLDGENYIQALKERFGHIGEGQETLYLAIIPMVNAYYERGKSGNPYDLPNTDEEIEEIKDDFRNRNGKLPNAQVLEILSRVFAWCRDAYEQGQRDRGTPLPLK